MSPGRGGQAPAAEGVGSDGLLRAARWLIYATALVPVALLPGFYFPYVTVRAVYFRVLVELATAILLYLVVRRSVTINFRRDIVFWALAAWVGANALAAVTGAAPMRSIFGDHERMGGVWFWIHLLAYYVLLRTFLRPADWPRFFQISVGIAAVIAAYGLIQHWASPFSFGIAGVGAGVTIGNPGLLAVYLLANIALCALLAARGGTASRIAWSAVALLLATGLVFSGNRSSTLALFIGAGVAFVAYAIWSRTLRGWRAVAIVLLLVTGATLPFVSGAAWARPVTSRVPALDRLSGGVDSARVVQWRAAVDGIRSRPLLGVGPENYQIVWSQYYHPEMYRFLGDSRWDRAHNAYLDAFATAGVLGFLSLLAVFFALAWAPLRAVRRRREDNGDANPDHARPPVPEAVALGFVVAYAFYLFFWFFDLNSAMLWIAIAAFVSGRATGQPLLEFGAARGKRWQSTLVLGAGAVALVAVLYVHGYETLKMARTLDRARDSRRPFQETLADFESVFGSPAPVTQHAFLMYASQLRSLSPSFPAIRRDPARAASFDRAFVLAIEEFERQANQDPLNERTLVQHARVLMLGAHYYGNPRLYASALARLQRAVELAPRRVVTRLVLGTAHLNAGQTELALRVFREAHAIYPPLGQTHSYLARAHARVGNTDSAGHWLRSAVAHGYMPDAALVQDVAGRLWEAGNPRAGAELAGDYLRKKRGPAFMWRGTGAPPDRRDSDLASLAADLLSAAGSDARAAAIRAAAPALCASPVPLQALAGRPSRAGELFHPSACREPWFSKALGNGT